MIMLIAIIYTSIWALGSQHNNAHLKDTMDEADLNWVFGFVAKPTSMVKIVWPIASPLTMIVGTLDVVLEERGYVSMGGEIQATIV